MQNKYIIIGSSAAAIAAINTIVRFDKNPNIICVSKEEENPYNKCLIVDYLSGDKVQDETYTLNSGFCEKNKINLLLGSFVTKINPKQKVIIVDHNKQLQYDFLFIATGASPVLPKIAGLEDIKGIFTFHTLKNTNEILSFIKNNNPKKAIVIGAGLSGLECVDGLVSHNIKVCLVDMQEQLLHKQIDKKASEFIQNNMTKKGVFYYFNTSVSEVKNKEGKVVGALLSNGIFLEADMIIFTIGSQPNSQLAIDARIALKGKSIFVNEYMQTSEPNIYAGGDVVVVKDILTKKYVRSCTWPDAMQQGVVAACAMLNKKRKYQGALSIVSSAFFDMKFVSCGQIEKINNNDEVIIYSSNNYYHKFLLRDNRLIGYLMVGQIKKIGIFRRAYLTQEIINKEVFFN